ncbi:hypothetical protein Clow_01685 [Corynebacterium lowii]|uniref:Uncharacterized protein n=1 Tax=Corynebacterium lowii TaxID=1544413 RepID=A0A0Q0UDH3_9CORY|nr:hypothetical protein Clow_01685 [Corynebacterium lowii]MDP9850627.1 hypothetical protein [Corynebacterium lowii]
MVHNGAYGDTWYGLDLGMWVAAQRRHSVPERMLGVAEAEMCCRGNPIRLEESIACLRAMHGRRRVRPGS